MSTKDQTSKRKRSSKSKSKKTDAEEARKHKKSSKPEVDEVADNADERKSKSKSESKSKSKTTAEPENAADKTPKSKRGKHGDGAQASGKKDKVDRKLTIYSLNDASTLVVPKTATVAEIITAARAEPKLCLGESGESEMLLECKIDSFTDQ